MMMVPINIRPTRTSSLFFIVCSSRSGSSCVASCLKIGGEEKRGERIQNQDRYRRDDDCLRGAPSNTLRADIGGITLVRAEEGDRSAEQHRLDHAVDDLERS